MKQRYYLALTTEEWRLMIESLNNLRNRLISEGKYTDAVDEVLIKGGKCQNQEVQNCRAEGLIMEKYITDEHTGLKYELVGDYYLIAGDDEPEQEPIGIWGQRHLRYLREHHRVRYANLLTNGKMNAYLADIDRQAEELFLRLVKQVADADGITEKLKACDQMKWVGRMNSIRDRVTEIVNNELILI